MKWGFDEILNFLTDMVKSDLFMLPDKETDLNKINPGLLFIIDLKKEIRKIKITNSLLKTLETDYQNFSIKMKKKMVEYKKKINKE